MEFKINNFRNITRLKKDEPQEIRARSVSKGKSVTLATLRALMDAICFETGNTFVTNH